MDYIVILLYIIGEQNHREECYGEDPSNDYYADQYKIQLLSFWPGDQWFSFTFIQHFYLVISLVVVVVFIE